MNQINCCALKPLYLYSGFCIEDECTGQYIGEYILGGDFWVFEINGELTYDFITSLN